MERQVRPQVRFPVEAVPAQRGSLLLERQDSLLLELLGSQLQALPGLQPGELRAEMFVVAREIARVNLVQTRVRLGRQ
ncbi:MAG: hypothetical protein DMF37_08005 [Verrucomicrobia bacterium]|nr:MAG: hypothetical protein DMF37_08005 [Verrucomicrobiota bacterium]